MAREGSRFFDGLKTVLLVLRSLSTVAGSMIESRVERLIELQRRELERAARILALSVAAALFVVAATAFAGLAVLIAAGDAHRVAAAVGVAVVFGLLALIAITLARAQ